MALTLRYVGARPYTEFKVNGVLYAFSRGMTRDDLPEDWIRGRIIPQIESGATAWEVVDGDATQIAMLEILDEPEPEVVEEVVEVVVEEVVEVVVEETPSVDVDALLESNGFSSLLTRAQMMSWCSERGVSVQNTDTKASLTDKAREYITGASE